MANKPKTMHQIQEIFRRKKQGESNRSIVRKTGFSRRTITEYLSILSCAGNDPRQASELSEESLLQFITQFRQGSSGINEGRKLVLEGQFATFNKELDKPGVTRLLLWQEYLKARLFGRCC
jgi:hypothetical protein